MIIILHRTQMAENIGFAARSMKNFGLKELRLVSPGLMEEDEWEAEENNKKFDLSSFLKKAEAVAKVGGEIVKNAKIYNTIEEAGKDLSHIYALSARRRDITKEVITPNKAIDEILNIQDKCAFLFGRESSGLSNSDLTSCYKMVEIEAEKAYSSINLGMSVGIISYLLHKKNFNMNERGIRSLASVNEVAFLTSFLIKKLENAEYFKVSEKKEGMEVNIKNIFAKNQLSKAEVKTLIGIFNLIKR